MRVALHTFGCKLNQYETEALAHAFQASGHEVGTVRGGGDLYIVNTCTVTSKGEQKARRLIRALQLEAPGAVIVVTGCYAQTEAESIRRMGGNVLCVPQERKPLLLELARRLPAGGEIGTTDANLAGLLEAVRAALDAPAGGAVGSPFSYSVGHTTFHARATLKIQDGCDYGCAYCRVPLARGPSVSRSGAEVLAEARALEASGHREIVITGVNIAAYGSGGMELADLVRAILDETGSLRVRLSSLEPERVRGKLLDVLAHERVCPHFHLPVQSGSDSVLAAMGRRYRAGDVRAAVAALRQAQDDPFIAADLIAGFPGESEADHAQSAALVEACAFAQLHVFPFSPRPGTRAWTMRPRVPERIRDGRTRALRGMSERCHHRYVEGWVGREVEVLVEKMDHGRAQGTSGNYLKVRLEGAGASRGQMVRAVLTRADLLTGAPAAAEEGLAHSESGE